ncbi:MAG: hydrogenase maturation protease [Candidatus Cloacimonetes bacterium]|nr:hydrogenase maturation protease [Candidatus Cloacimonadota bacterium]
MKILIYGYGNPGRRDDGLGVLFAEAIQSWAADSELDYICCDSNYQLNIEDADNIAAFDIVVFADATVEEAIEDFKLTRLQPSAKQSFTMHSVSPEFVLDLSARLTETPPEAYLLHLRGFEWDFMAKLTDKAASNLTAALEMMKPLLSSAEEYSLATTVDLLNNYCR